MRRCRLKATNRVCCEVHWDKSKNHSQGEWRDAEISILSDWNIHLYNKHAVFSDIQSLFCIECNLKFFQLVDLFSLVYMLHITISLTNHAKYAICHMTMTLGDEKKAMLFLIKFLSLMAMTNQCLNYITHQTLHVFLWHVTFTLTCVLFHPEHACMRSCVSVSIC